MSEALPKCLLALTCNCSEILIKIELFRAGGRIDGQTDMAKLIVAFRNFTNAPTSDHKRAYAKHIINSGRPVKIKVSTKKESDTLNKNLSTKRNIYLISISKCNIF
jgi:hypothetical protein